EEKLAALTCLNRFADRGVSLFPWQERAARFYATQNDLWKTQKGVVTKAKMGTGKTLTLMASGDCWLDRQRELFREKKRTKEPKVILVTPAAVEPQWRESFTKFKVPTKDWILGLHPENFKARAPRDRDGNIDCKGDMLIVDELHRFRTPIQRRRCGPQ